MQMTFKQARLNAGLKQSELAEKMNVSVATISMWEQGKTEMTLSKFDRFCEIVGQNRADIIIPNNLS